MPLRSYRGYRRGHIHTLDDEWQVFSVNGKRLMTELPPRNDLANHSPDGFSWGFSGSGPAQLALAILAHHLAHSKKRTVADSTALGLYQRFKEVVVAAMDQEEDWVLTANDVDRGIAAAEGI